MPSTGSPVPRLSADEAAAIARLDATGQAELVRSGAVPPGAPVAAAIARIEQLDGPVNAVCHRSFDTAQEAAPGPGAPMAGVPYLLKASLEHPGFPCESGSRAKRGVVARRGWPLGERFDQAGLVPVGMSTMPEFGLLASGEALLTGPTHNPWDLARSAGGSSTGAAAAVAAGMVPLAHASDAAGSIRMPASCCGVVGFKATRGWNVRARAPHWIDDLLCSDGLLSRSIRDAAWAARWLRPSAIVAPPAPSGRLRIAVDLTALHGGQPEPAVAEAIRRVATSCAGLGHAVEERVTELDRPAAMEVLHVLWPYLGGELFDGFTALHPGAASGDILEPWTIGLAEHRNTITPDRLARALAAIGSLSQEVARWHQTYDVVLSPVNPTPPPMLGHLAPDRPFAELWTALWAYMSYTPLQNITGTPSITLPLEMADGLPVGALLSAARGSDELLLALAAELEVAAPWQDRRAPVW